MSDEIPPEWAHLYASVGHLLTLDGATCVIVGTISAPDGRKGFGVMRLVPGALVRAEAWTYERLPETERCAPTESGYVLQPHVAERLGTPRVLAHRLCCGWDWATSEAEFLTVRNDFKCETFHTFNHGLAEAMMDNPNFWAEYEAKNRAEWKAIEAILNGGAAGWSEYDAKNRSYWKAILNGGAAE